MATLDGRKILMKISASVSGQGSGNVYTLVYTCPSNSYAVINVFGTPNTGAGDAASVYVGNVGHTLGSFFQAFRNSATNVASNCFKDAAISSQGGFEMIVGPGQSVYCIGSISSGTAYISGIEYQNTGP